MHENEVYKVGIIGIEGRMGRWLADYLTDLGHDVSGYDIRPMTKYPRESAKDMARHSDILVVSVPIIDTEEVIRNVGPYLREDSLFTDMTSVKYKPVKAMLESSGCEVIGTHPMFAPRVKSIKGQKMVIIQGRGKYWLPRWRHIFEEQGACIKITTPEKHDRIMAIVQGMTHARNIIYAMALKELSSEWEIDIRETMEFTSPVYRIEQGMTGRILSQGPELYGSIQMDNQDSQKALEELRKATEKLFEIVKRKDMEAFKDDFRQCRDLFGELSKKLTTETDFLIKQLAGYKNDLSR